tara:strand:- start:357 stop:560 length:204 start_codon:yes stop_codon:yes gene_type:complete
MLVCVVATNVVKSEFDVIPYHDELLLDRVIDFEGYEPAGENVHSDAETPAKYFPPSHNIHTERPAPE